MPDDPAVLGGAALGGAPREPTAVEIEAVRMEALRFLHTRLKKPLDVAVGRVSKLAMPGEASPPVDVGAWRVKRFGDLIELGRLVTRRELLLDQPLTVTLFLYLAEECGLTIPEKG